MKKVIQGPLFEQAGVRGGTAETQRTSGSRPATDPRPATDETDSLFALALEPRLLLDAAAVATGAETAEAADAAQTSGASPDSADAADPNTAGDELAAAALSDRDAQADTVVFVDTGVEGWQILADGVAPSAQLVLVGPNEDGMRVMADTLAGRSEVESVHVLGHGGVGAFTLGNARINADTLDQYQGELGVISQALSSAADLLLYGCYVGADGGGQAFVNALAEATGADVAASSDATGADTLNGDWDLEIATGDIDATLPVNSAARANFDGVLVNFSFDSGITEPNNTTLIQTIGTDYVTVTTTSGDLYIYNGDEVGHSFAFGNVGDTMTIEFNGGVDFNLDNFTIYNPAGAGTISVDVEGFYAGGGSTSETISVAALTGVTDSNGIGGSTGAFTRVEFTNNAGGDVDIFLDDLDMTQANAAPSVGGTVGGVDFTENAGAVDLVTAAESVGDGDSANFDTGFIEVTLDAYQTGDTLSVNGALPTGATIDGTSDGDGTALRINFDSDISPADAQTLLEQLQFNNTTDDPTAGGTDADRAVTITVDDGDGGSNAISGTLAIDAVPDVTGVAVTDGTYSIGDTIPVTVTFDQTVNVNTGGGTPTIEIVVGGTTRQASYASGSGSSTLTFEYTVVEADSDDADGIAVSADTLALNGGTILDGDGDTPDLTHAGVAGSGETVDATRPTVDATAPDGAAGPTDASVDFTVTFSEPVDLTTLGAGDFALTTTGSAGGTIAPITLTGTGSSATVTVNSISGDGSIRLDFTGGAGEIADVAGNLSSADFTTGTAHTVDRVAPAITGTPTISDATITQSDTSGTVTVTINFTEAMDSSGDLTFSFPTAGENASSTLSLDAAASGWSNGDQTYTAVFNVADNDQTLSAVDLQVSGFADTAGNSGGSTLLSDLITTIDTDEPTLASIVRLGSATINGSTAGFTVTFDQPVGTVVLGDFTLATTGGQGGASVTGISGTGDTRTVTVTTVDDAAGDIRLDLADADSSIQDPNGNTLTTTTVTGDTYTVDRIDPTLSAVDLVAASDTGNNNADDITSDATPTIEFTAENGATVAIDWDDGSGFLLASAGTGAAQQETFAGYATDGTKTITVRATDTVGNVTTQTLSITLDTTAPTLPTNTGVGVLEGGTTTIGPAALSASDAVAGGADLVFTLVGTTNGSVAVGGSTLSNGDTFTQADIGAGDLSFTHDDSETTTASFDFTVTDSAGNVLSGQSTSVNVTPVNDNPAVANDDTATTDEDTAISRSAANGVIDPNDTDVDGIASLSVTGVTNGTDSVGAATQIAGDQGGLFTINADGSYAFDPNGDFDDLLTGSRATAVTYTLSDGTNTDIATLTVTVTGVNDAPAISGLFGETSSVVAGGSFQNVAGFDDAGVSNTDSPDYNLGSLTIAPGTGTHNGSWGLDSPSVEAVDGMGNPIGVAADARIRVDSGAGFVEIGTVDSALAGQAGNTLFIEFNSNATSDRIQTLIQAFTYDAPSALGLRTFNLILSDNDGGTDSVSGNFTIDVTPNPPEIANVGGDTPSFTEGDTETLLDVGGDAAVTDPDSGDFNSGSLTVSITSGGVMAEDVLTIQNQGTGAGEIGFSGGVVTYEGTQIGTVTGGIGGADLVIILDADAQPNSGTGSVSALISALVYQNSAGDDPTGGDRTIQLTLDDGGSSPATDTATLTLSVTPVNDAPTVSVTSDNPTYTENATAVSIFSGAAISVVEAGQNIDQVVFDVTGVQDGASEVLVIDSTDVALAAGSTALTGGSGLSAAVVDNGGGSFTVTLSGASLSGADAAALVNGLAYRVDGEAPTGGARTVTLTSVRDDGGTANSGSDTNTVNQGSTVTVTPVNDAPQIFHVAAETTDIATGEGAQDVALLNDAILFDPDSPNFGTGVLEIAQTSGATDGEWRLDTNVALTSGGMFGPSNPNFFDNATVEVDLNGDGTFTAIGQVDGTNTGIAGDPLRITLNPDATQARILALLGALEYDIPAGSTLGARDFDLTLHDGDGGTSAAAGFTLNAVPPAPEIATIASTTADGLYGVSDSVNVTLTLDTPSDFTAGGGTLRATLSNGATVVLASADATNTTTFAGTYTISEGDGDVTDLNVTAVSLTGGATLIANGGTQAADLSLPPLTSNLADSEDIDVDANTPTVAAPDLTAATDTGVSDSDDLTNDTTATVTGTTEANANVSVRVGGAQVGTTTADGAGAWSFTFAAGDLVEGTNAVDIVASDAAGNASADSADLMITLDSIAPLAAGDIGTATEGDPASNLGGLNVAGNDTGATAPANDPVTAVAGNAANLGTAVAGDNGGLFTVNADGTVSFDPNGDFDALAAGATATTTVTVTVRDDAGNTDTAGLTVIVTGINDAPSLTGTANLPAVDEDAGDPPGATVSSLFGGLVADVDSGASFAGIAVTGNAATPAEGAWQVQIAGTGWNDLPAVSDTNALLLSGASALRFVPAADFNGTPGALSVRAVDDSYGGAFSTAPGGSLTAVTQDVTGANSGGTTAFAGAETDLTTSITAVNDAPTATGVPTTISATEDVPSGVDLAGLTLADVDAAGSDIVLTLAVDAGTLAATSGSGVTVTNSGTGTLTLTGSVADLNGFLADASAVQYTSAPDANGTATLTLTANDQGHTGSGAGTEVALGSASIDVTPVNDAPTVVSAPSDQSAEAGEAFEYELPAGTFDDVDAGDTLTLTAGLAGGGALPDWLSFDPATRTFSGAPETTDTGTLTIVVTATDSAKPPATATTTFDLTVEGDPASPSLTTLDRGPVRVTVIETGGESVLIANSAVVSGAALDAILGTFERGNSPLAQSFRAAVDNLASDSSDTLQNALGDAKTRQKVQEIADTGGETLIFQDGAWRPLDLETILQLSQATGAPVVDGGLGDLVQTPVEPSGTPVRTAAAPQGEIDAAEPNDDPETAAALAAARANAKAHWLDAAIAALAEAEPLEGTGALAALVPTDRSGETGGFGGQLRERASAFDRDAAALADSLAATAA